MFATPLALSSRLFTRLDRDRAVDESGNQLSVFNRRGSRPFTLEETKRMYIHPANGQFYSVTNDPPGPPVPIR
jgi:hypothetical protein